MLAVVFGNGSHWTRGAYISIDTSIGHEFRYTMRIKANSIAHVGCVYFGKPASQEIAECKHNNQHTGKFGFHGISFHTSYFC